MNMNDIDLAEVLPIFFIALIGILIIALLTNYIISKKDDKKELITKKVKILEKPIQQGNVEWYVVEDGSGNRFKLRNLQANEMIISIGDIGIVKYRGQTIKSFQRI